MSLIASSWLNCLLQPSHFFGGVTSFVRLGALAVALSSRRRVFTLAIAQSPCLLGGRRTLRRLHRYAQLRARPYRCRTYAGMSHARSHWWLSILSSSHAAD